MDEPQECITQCDVAVKLFPVTETASSDLLKNSFFAGMTWA